ncbi:hypothetical protein MUK42_11205, partial [Musa troglodytarum]
MLRSTVSQAGSRRSSPKISFWWSIHTMRPAPHVGFRSYSMDGTDVHRERELQVLRPTVCETRLVCDPGYSGAALWRSKRAAEDVDVMTNTAMEEDPHSNVSSSRERYAEFMKDSCCARYFLGPNPSIARFVYALIFLVTCLLAWTVRDYGRNALSELEIMWWSTRTKRKQSGVAPTQSSQCDTVSNDGVVNENKEEAEQYAVD